MTTNDSFYFNKPDQVKSCLLALRDIILSSDNRLEETVKYGMPCFCIKKRAMCYLWTDKKTNEPYILFVDGNKMVHPALESGSRKRMKTVTVPSSKDIDLKLLTTLLNEMLALV